MNELEVRATADGCVLSVRVHPGARLNAVTGVHNGALKLSVTAPATDGRANEAVLKLLAERLGVPYVRVRLVRGPASRMKVLEVVGLTPDEVIARLRDS